MRGDKPRPDFRISSSPISSSQPWAANTARSRAAWALASHVGRWLYTFVSVRFFSSASVISSGFSQLRLRWSRRRAGLSGFEVEMASPGWQDGCYGYDT
jgi:hypothetical protein